MSLICARISFIRFMTFFSFCPRCLPISISRSSLSNSLLSEWTVTLRSRRPPRCPGSRSSFSERSASSMDFACLTFLFASLRRDFFSRTNSFICSRISRCWRTFWISSRTSAFSSFLITVCSFVREFHSSRVVRYCVAFWLTNLRFSSKVSFNSAIIHRTCSPCTPVPSATDRLAYPI